MVERGCGSVHNCHHYEVLMRVANFVKQSQCILKGSKLLRVDLDGESPLPPWSRLDDGVVTCYCVGHWKVIIGVPGQVLIPLTLFKG